MTEKRQIGFPEYPKVEVQGTAIVITYEDGLQEVWGHEANSRIAQATCEDIQLGLRAINYVKLSLAVYVNKLTDELLELDIPGEYVEDIIYEGYLNLQRWFRELSGKSMYINRDRAMK